MKVAGAKVILVALLSAASMPILTSAMSEGDRLHEYNERGYEWPIAELVPNTEGWKQIFKRRWEQIERIEDSNARYNAWVQSMSSAMTAQNFTENG